MIILEWKFFLFLKKHLNIYLFFFEFKKFKKLSAKLVLHSRKKSKTEKNCNFLWYCEYPALFSYAGDNGNNNIHSHSF